MKYKIIILLINIRIFAEDKYKRITRKFHKENKYRPLFDESYYTSLEYRSLDLLKEPYPFSDECEKDCFPTCSPIPRHLTTPKNYNSLNTNAIRLKDFQLKRFNK